ncbi:hypothetical protein HPB50_006323 [Hyalomma asiaticum]|uniref:Uncharacterized protein n=1 Tax=Hyalomma asiaticum TaxID=266040 RepID=A0ACB7TD12_HYAAI|nr:hypothetical protein HPB50_006323 [Hyalomma asiaticum]
MNKESEADGEGDHQDCSGINADHRPPVGEVTMYQAPEVAAAEYIESVAEGSAAEDNEPVYNLPVSRPASVTGAAERMAQFERPCRACRTAESQSCFLHPPDGSQASREREASSTCLLGSVNGGAREPRTAEKEKGVRNWKAETDDFTDCEELCQEVIKLTGNCATESDVTFLEYAPCEQEPVAGEMTDTEIVQTATNGGDAGDDSDDEPPREVPTSAKTRNSLCLPRNKAECRGGEDRLMQCVKQPEDAFLGPSTTAKQTSIRQFFSAK